MSLADMRIAGPDVFVLWLVHPDYLDEAEEVEAQATTLREGWRLLIEEAQLAYGSYMRVRGVTDGYGATVLDYGREGIELGTLSPAKLPS